MVIDISGWGRLEHHFCLIDDYVLTIGLRCRSKTSDNPLHIPVRVGNKGCIISEYVYVRSISLVEPVDPAKGSVTGKKFIVIDPKWSRSSHAFVELLRVIYVH